MEKIEEIKLAKRRSLMSDAGLENVRNHVRRSKARLARLRNRKIYVDIDYDHPEYATFMEEIFHDSGRKRKMISKALVPWRIALKDHALANAAMEARGLVVERKIDGLADWNLAALDDLEFALQCLVALPSSFSSFSPKDHCPRADPLQLRHHLQPTPTFPSSLPNRTPSKARSSPSSTTSDPNILHTKTLPRSTSSVHDLTTLSLTISTHTTRIDPTPPSPPISTAEMSYMQAKMTCSDLELKRFACCFLNIESYMTAVPPLFPYLNLQIIWSP